MKMICWTLQGGNSGCAFSGILFKTSKNVSGIGNEILGFNFNYQRGANFHKFDIKIMIINEIDNSKFKFLVADDQNVVYEHQQGCLQTCKLTSSR